MTEPHYYEDEPERRAAGLTAFGKPVPTTATPTHLTITSVIGAIGATTARMPEMRR